MNVSDIWQGVRRLGGRKCPKCGVNEADLLPDEHMQTFVVQQRSHRQTIWHEDRERGRYPESRTVWLIKEKCQCRHCYQEWYEERESETPSYAPYINENPIPTLAEEALETLERLLTLKEQGTLSPQEFEVQKRKILG